MGFHEDQKLQCFQGNVYLMVKFQAVRGNILGIWECVLNPESHFLSWCVSVHRK